jgi:hypothetical protein
MKLMGHSTVTVSQRYLHPSPETMERAVSRLDPYNTVNVRGVGTKSGTVDVTGLSDNSQVV